MVALFRKVSGKDDLAVSFSTLADESVPALLTVSEESRRLADMMRMYGGNAPAMDLPIENTLVLNRKNPLILRLAEKAESENAALSARMIYTLALMAQRPLTADEMREFMQGGYDALSLILS